jgi:hypothetical protein
MDVTRDLSVPPCGVHLGPCESQADVRRKQLPNRPLSVRSIRPQILRPWSLGPHVELTENIAGCGVRRHGALDQGARVVAPGLRGFNVRGRRDWARANASHALDGTGPSRSRAHHSMKPRQKATSSSTAARADWSTSIKGLERQRERCSVPSADPSNRSAEPGDWSDESGDADPLLPFIVRPTLAVLLPWSTGAAGGSTPSMGLAALHATAERLPGRMFRGLRLQAPGASLPQEPGRLCGGQLLDRVAVERFCQCPGPLALHGLLRSAAWQRRFPSAHETPPDAGVAWGASYPRGTRIRLTRGAKSLTPAANRLG